jgi:prepilin-type N-terminal cleavage/methylation domain-containing protein
MRRRRVESVLRHEGGFSLVELLAGMAIFTVVLGATLDALGTFALGIEQNQRRNDTQQQARTALDQMARELRNLASPTPGRPEAVDTAAAYDLVFQTVDAAGPNAGANAANVRRARYCLDTSDPRSGIVWKQVQTWTQSTTPALPSTGSCPDPDTRWVSKQAVATNVVNRISGQDRPIWAYNAATTPDVSFIRTTVYVDRRPGSAPGESTLSTGVFLRNQNRPPVAAFTATITGNRHVLLNGSPSSDPEGQPLTYAWYDGATQVGSGITHDYQAPATGERSLTLKVSDPGGLQADAPVQTVTVQ